jgi:cell wall-associated NlpC family hydrolase
VIREAQLLEAAAEWLGTPFHRYASLKGVGVDCVNLVARLYEVCGVLEAPVVLPRYSMDAGNHLDSSILLRFVDQTGRFAEIGLEAAVPAMGCRGCGEVAATAGVPHLQVGDLVGFRVGRVVHHAGVYLGGPDRLFIHALERYGVVTHTILDSTWLDRIAAIRRPIL